MSVATQFAPSVVIPSHARLRATDLRDSDRGQLATVTVLHGPGARSVAAPVRLTRRGVAVLAAAVAVLAVGLVWLAWLSAPTAPAAPPAAVPASVVVHDGDTLWTIATRLAPDRDPRAEVARLQRLNHLGAVDLVAGQVLRTR